MRKNATNTWFFTDTPPLLKLFLIFIKGDMILLIPLVLLIILSYFISVKLGVILTGSYLLIRFLGEMFYWLMQQFGDRTYRPYDYGFTQLDNHAVYILYQTFAVFGSLCGVGLILCGFFLIQ